MRVVTTCDANFCGIPTIKYYGICFCYNRIYKIQNMFKNNAKPENFCEIPIMIRVLSEIQIFEFAFKWEKNTYFI